MAKTAGTERASLVRRLWAKRVTRISLAVLIVVGAAISLVPFGAKLYVQKWLVANGADSAIVQKIRINPFTGTVGLHGVDVRHNDKQVFSDSTIKLNIGLGMLFSREAHVQEATLANVVIDLERFKDGSFRIGSYTLAGQVEETADQAVGVASAGEINPWLLFVREVDIENVTVHYKQPDLNMTCVVEKGSIVKFNTNPEEKKGSVSLKGLFNDAPFDIQLSQVAVLPHLFLEGRVKLAAVDLQDFRELLKNYVSPFQGVAGLDGTLTFTMDNSNSMDVLYDGAIGYNKGELGGDQWLVDGTANWLGKVAFQMNNNEIQVATEGIMELVAPSFSLHTGADKLAVGSEKLAYEGKVIYTQQFGDVYKATVDTEGRLRGQLTEFGMPSISIGQGTLDAKGTTKVALGNKLRVTYQGRLDLTDTRVDLEDRVSTEGHRLVWNGLGKYSLEKKSQEVVAKGKLTTEKLAVDLKSSGMQIAQAKGSVQSDLTLKFTDNQPFFSGKASVEAADMQLNKGETSLVQLESLAIRDAKDDTQGGLAVASVELSNLVVAQSEISPVQVSLPSAVMGNISSPDFTTIAVGELKLTKPEVTDKQNNKQLAVLESIQAVDINAAVNGAVTADKLMADGGEFFLSGKPDASPLVTLGGIEARALQWSVADGFFSKAVTVDSLYANITREKAATESGTSGQQPESAEEDVASQEKKHGLPVRINTINVVGKSGFGFTDTTLSSTFFTELLLDQGQINDIDLNQPEKPFSYALQGAFDTYSPLKIEGTCAPVAENFLLNQKTTLKNYSLQKLSPYVVDAIGTYFVSGQLDLVSTKKIVGDDLDLDNDFVFQGIEAQTVNAELAAKLNNKLPVPLDVALSMLRDSSGNIELAVPVSGKVDDLHFGLTDIVITAMGTAIAIGVAPYLAYTFLGPTGALVYLGGKIGQALLETNLPTLTFRENAEELSEEQKKTLEKVGKAIRSDAKSTYSICAKVALSELGDGEQATEQSGYAIASDEKLGKQLFDIGESRSMAVKTFLEETMDVNSEQLLICNPGINHEKGGATIIEFKK